MKYAKTILLIIVLMFLVGGCKKVNIENNQDRAFKINSREVLGDTILEEEPTDITLFEEKTTTTTTTLFKPMTTTTLSQNKATVNEVDAVFTKLELNDMESTTSIFNYKNNEIKQIPINELSFDIKNVKGSVGKINIKVWKECDKQRIDGREYNVSECFETGEYDKEKNPILKCENTSKINDTVINYKEYDYCDSEYLPSGETKYFIYPEQVNFENCGDSWCGQVEWIPKINIEGKEYVQEKWAWWNYSYTKRRPINCTNISVGNQIVINGTYGITLNTTKLFIHTYCKTEPIYLYYNSNISYAVGNETSIIYHYTETNTSSNGLINWRMYAKPQTPFNHTGAWYMSRTGYTTAATTNEINWANGSYGANEGTMSDINNNFALNQTGIIGKARGGTGYNISSHSTPSITSVPKYYFYQTADFSISYWCKFNQTWTAWASNSYACQFMSGRDNAANQVNFLINIHNNSGTKVNFTINNAGVAAQTNLTTSTEALSTNNWHNIVATWNATNKSMKLYINGQLKNSSTLAGASSTGAEGPLFKIASSYDNTRRSYGSTFDQMLFENREYNSQEIIERYRNVNGTYIGYGTINQEETPTVLGSTVINSTAILQAEYAGEMRGLNTTFYRDDEISTTKVGSNFLDLKGVYFYFNTIAIPHIIATNISLVVNVTRIGDDISSSEKVSLVNMNYTIINNTYPDNYLLFNLTQPWYSVFSPNRISGYYNNFTVGTLTGIRVIPLNNNAINNVTYRDYFSLGFNSEYIDKSGFGDSYIEFNSKNSSFPPYLNITFSCILNDNNVNQDWNITDDCYIANHNLTVPNNIYIHTNGSLTLYNTTLNFIGNNKNIIMYKNSSKPDKLIILNNTVFRK